MSLQKIPKIDEAISLSYQWFESEFLPKVNDALINFWESDFEVRLFSVSNFDTIKKDKLSAGVTYFAKPVAINAHQRAIYRLSSEFVRTVLHSVLGSSSPQFQLSTLSDLEVEIINAFLEFLHKSVVQNFTPYDEIPKFALKDREEVNLTFFIRKKCKDTEVCTPGVKFVITLPKNVLVPNYIPKTKQVENYIPDTFSTRTSIRAGSTKLSLSELKMLMTGDIVMLEKSNVNKMAIKSGTLFYPFKVNPDPSLILDLDEDEHDINGAFAASHGAFMNTIGGGANMADKNMWDDIQIEVNAEFEKVKMTLGELKQISAGMVIDLADTFSGKISLVVEDKVVARGDLVIVNDRYGVKLNEIIQEKPPAPPAAPRPGAQAAAKPAAAAPQKPAAPAQAAAPNPAAAPAQPKPAATQSQGAGDENFDYSDFEAE